MILALSLAVVVAFAGGLLMGADYAKTRALRRLGLTRRSARLYREAASILADLAVTDRLDEVNVLAPQVRERVNKWLANHRKESNR